MTHISLSSRLKSAANAVVSYRYAVLFGQAPSVKATAKSAEDVGIDISHDSELSQKFIRRITHLLRRENLSKSRMEEAVVIRIY